MRTEYIKKGKILPLKILAGPNNPLGSYALYLGNNYAIHGTHTNFSMGLRATRGCIRLQPKDIKYLYTLVPIGTRVQFINEPIKIYTDKNGNQYLEIHHPVLINNNNKKHSAITTTTNLKEHTYSRLKNIKNVDYKIVDKAIQECLGIPINITIHCSK